MSENSKPATTLVVGSVALMSYMAFGLGWAWKPEPQVAPVAEMARDIAAIAALIPQPAVTTDSVIVITVPVEKEPTVHAAQCVVTQ